MSATLETKTKSYKTGLGSEKATTALMRTSRTFLCSRYPIDIDLIWID